MDKRIELIKGDITKVKVDAIVNAAKIALENVSSFLVSNDTILKVIFVCYDDESFNIYSEIMKENMSRA